MFQGAISYSPVYCLDIPAQGDDPIRAESLNEKLSLVRDASGLLIRTGAGILRASDPESYATVHPWIHPSVARALRERCPFLRILGLDTISISTPSYRMEGRESHRAFLCHETPIILLEDADLSQVQPGDSFTLTLIPWIVGDLDGVPVTAFLTANS